MSKKGFTLIELMVVIAIIGVLSAVLAPQLFKQINKGRIAATISFYNALKTASNSYYSDTEQWPSSTYDLAAMIAASGCGSGGTVACPAGWAGPYVDRWPGAGAWAGSTYTWASDSSNPWLTAARYVILTCGATGSCTTTDFAEIDKKIDGGAASGTLGAMRYSGTTAQMLISAN